MTPVAERPHVLKSERELLGCLILAPSALPEAQDYIDGPHFFTSEAHGLIWNAIGRLVDASGKIDPTLLMNDLKRTGVLDLVGGETYIDNLCMESSAAAHIVPHAKEIGEAYRRRSLLDIGEQLVSDVRKSDDTTDGLIETLETRVFALTGNDKTGERPSTLEECLQDQYARQIALDNGKPDGVVPTGFKDLDEVLNGGLAAGELIILAARTSVGKTAFAMNVAEQAALGSTGPNGIGAHKDRAISVGIFSLEMSRSQLTDRVASAWSGLSTKDLRRGLTAPQLQTLLDAQKDLRKARIAIDDVSSLTITRLRTRARRMIQRYKCELLIVDYLQLLSSPQQSRESRQVEVSAITRGLKALARELKIPVLALAQLNRLAEMREDGRPKLSDLRESGSIEQDADVVLLLYREAAHHRGDKAWEEKNPQKVRAAECIVAKQRNGPIASVPMIFDAASTRFLTGDAEQESSVRYTPPSQPINLDERTDDADPEQQ